MQLTQGGASRRIAALAACLLAGACDTEPDPYRTQLAAFGTVVSIQLHGVTADTAERAITRLAAHYRERGRDWYPWADGELARINRAIARNEAAVVSEALRSLLQRAAELEQASSGRFNAALGQLTELWGFNDPLQAGWQPPADDTIATLMPAPSLAALTWRGDTVESRDPRVMIDPGGIAKGALLAESVAILRAAGITDVIVDIGGDLVVSGSAGGRAARIGIRSPGGGNVLGWVDIDDGEAVVTSGNYERYFEHDDVRYAHVLDPATGRPAAGAAAVTVIHDDAVLADAAATALLVGGAGEFENLCDALGIHQALLVDTSGDLRLTPAMQGRVHWLRRD